MLTVMILLVSFLTNSVDNFLTLLNENGVQSSCKLSWGSCESSHGDACGTPAPSCLHTWDHCSIHILQHQLTSCGNHHDHSDQHGIHQQPWSHVQQYENGDNETLVLLVSYDTVGPSCHDNEGHHAAGTQYVHGHHGQDLQHRLPERQTGEQQRISFLI